MFDELKQYQQTGHFFFKPGNRLSEVCKAQLLKGRLTKGKQDGVPRQEYFDTRMKGAEIDGLDIYWWVTFDKKVMHLPGFVEGILMQRHFEIYGELPEWNKEF